MKNILIDTCSWIDLLTDGESKLLPHLKFWKENNCVNFVTHKIVIEEWNKHKILQRKNFVDSLRTKYNHAREIGKREKLLIPDDLEPNLHRIDSQIEIIDSILNDAFVLDTSDRIKAACSDRQISKKAPYHNKLDSTKDAYIIFSALEYFTEQKQDFLFISANKNEFGRPKELEVKIHPELVESYTEISVEYISDIGRAINSLRDILPASLQPEVNSESLSRDKEEINVDKRQHILDQVYDYITARDEEITFYPVSFLTDHYPFKLNSYTSYSIFNLEVDNEEVYNMFKTIEINEKNEIKILEPSFYQGVEDYIRKLENILKSLTQNLVFSVSSRLSREHINIRYEVTGDCECPMCLFYKFKFSDCFKTLNVLTGSDTDLQKSSYLNYRIGNYLYSVEKQKQALKKYIGNRSKKTRAFIGDFNLSKLSLFVRGNYYGENAQDNLITELKSIDLQKAELNRASDKNRRLLQYIRNHSFINNAKNKIHELSGKLIDQYYSSINGGTSSNSNVWLLINCFSELEGFLKRNYIIYDRFKDFRDLFSVFLEGLMASHAITENGHSRLEHFDDWLFEKILEYGNAESIIKHYRRYKIKKISYTKTSLVYSFDNLIDNFFNNSDLRKNFIENCEQNNRRFWEYYDSIFVNIITLVSISDMDTLSLNLFTRKLIDYLSKEAMIGHQSYKHIHTFLDRCGKELDVALLHELFQLGLNERLLHSIEYFETLHHIYEERKLDICIDSAQYDQIKRITFNECNQCRAKHSSSMIIFICLMIQDGDYKSSLKNEIILTLNQKFAFDLFYLATIFELIPLDEGFLDAAIELSLRNGRRSSFKSFFEEANDKRFDDVNSILNLCFKFDIDTVSSQKFEAYKTLGPYYDWLVDMEGFDYRQFDAKWIGEYSTRFYFKKIHDSAKTKEKLDIEIKNEFNAELERNYINIFIRKTWNRDSDET